MTKYITVFILFMTLNKISAQPHVDFKGVIQDSVKMTTDELEAPYTTVKLKNLTVVNNQMDSIMKNINKEKKGNYVSSYYLSLAKQNENLYIEIMNIDSHNNIINFAKRGVSSDNYLRKGVNILGCVVYNDSYFYVISFPKPNSAEEKDINCLFGSTDKDLIIKKERIDDSLFFIECPMRLYQYLDGKLHLLNSSVLKH